MVVSQNFSSATSLAMFAPISTLMVIPSFSWITSEMSLSPSGPSSTPWGNKSTTCWCLDQTPLNKLGNISEIKGVKSISSNKQKKPWWVIFPVHRSLSSLLWCHILSPQTGAGSQTPKCLHRWTPPPSPALPAEKGWWHVFKAWGNLL